MSKKQLKVQALFLLTLMFLCLRRIKHLISIRILHQTTFNTVKLSLIPAEILF